jgi:dUTP pyrophosphatase
MTTEETGDFYADDPALTRWHLQKAHEDLDRITGDAPIIKIKVGREGRMPTRVYRGDAGYDLYSSADTVVEAHTFVDVPTDIRMQLPLHMWAMITGRSSALRTHGLFVPMAIIDSGYRGELYTGVWNLTDETKIVGKGDRLAQLIPMTLDAARIVMRNASHIDLGDRGNSGFGSTGR